MKKTRIQIEMLMIIEIIPNFTFCNEEWGIPLS